MYWKFARVLAAIGAMLALMVAAAGHVPSSGVRVRHPVDVV